jgi:hypothetical protein
MPRQLAIYVSSSLWPTPPVIHCLLKPLSHIFWSTTTLNLELPPFCRYWGQSFKKVAAPVATPAPAPAVDAKKPADKPAEKPAGNVVEGKEPEKKVGEKKEETKKEAEKKVSGVF